MGLLGYECNLNEMSKEERKDIKRQVEEFKSRRKYFLDSDYYRYDPKEGVHIFAEVSKDQEHACVVLFYERADVGHMTDILPLHGLNKDYTYKVSSKGYAHNIKHFGGLVNQVSPIHIKNNSFLHNLIAKIIKMKENGEDAIVKGDVLMSKGYEVYQSFNGTGWSTNTKLIKDGESRIYFFDRIS
jgi:alpha-galactosidase